MSEISSVGNQNILNLQSGEIKFCNSLLIRNSGYEELSHEMTENECSERSRLAEMKNVHIYGDILLK